MVEDRHLMLLLRCVGLLPVLTNDHEGHQKRYELRGKNRPERTLVISELGAKHTLDIPIEFIAELLVTLRNTPHTLCPVTPQLSQAYDTLFFRIFLDFS